MSFKSQFKDKHVSEVLACTDHVHLFHTTISEEVRLEIGFANILYLCFCVIYSIVMCTCVIFVVICETRYLS